MIDNLINMCYSHSRVLYKPLNQIKNKKSTLITPDNLLYVSETKLFSHFASVVRQCGCYCVTVLAGLITAGL